MRPRPAHLLAPIFLGALVASAGASAAAPGAPPSQVILRWKPSTEAERYEVQIAADSAFARVVQSVTVEEPTYTWREYPATPHFWRVRVITASGRASAWSPARTIAVSLAAPTPLSPRAGAWVGVGARETPVSFSWQACALCLEYVLEVGRDAELAEPVATWQGRELEARLSLTGLGTFYWRVVGIDPAGQRSPSSAVVSLVLGLPAPTLLAPASGQRVSPELADAIELTWRPQPLARRWRVELRAGESALLATEVVEPRLVYTPTQPGSHTWTVTAVGEDGKAGAASEARPFFVELAVPVLLAPPPGAELHGPPLAGVDLVWAAVPLADRYTVELATDEAFTDIRASLTGADTRWRVEDVGAGTHWWRVRASSERDPATVTMSVSHFVWGREQPVEPVLPPPVEVLSQPSARSMWRLSARAGWEQSFAAFSSPHVGAAFGFSAPPGPWWLELRLGYGWESRRIRPPAATLQATTAVAHLVPLTLLGGAALELGGVTIYGGLGGGGRLVVVTANGETRAQLSPVGVLSAGARQPLGPGVVFVELDLSISRLDHRFVRMKTTGLLLAVGYGVDL
jgi:hypothetical protein